MIEPITHDSLCLLAEKFLMKNAFGVVFNDKFKAYTNTGEQPDCLGFRSGVSCLIECKTSRSDFLADKRKKFRVDPTLGMGDWRFFLAPTGLISVDELPTRWGLLETDGKRVKKISGFPMNTGWFDKPFTGNKQAECDYMYSACRRMVIRGHFKEIYDGVPIKEIYK
ncbi:hypothetical protein [Robertmurraya sp.]|uniref:hypothetical protein n=1 Tax=Robertmurraya sp. TaxID=2837525 RepID=UPI003703FB5A